MKIFFSHSSREKPLVREIMGYLPESISMWLDENNINVGVSIPAALKVAIEVESNIIVLIVSEEAVVSEWVLEELKWALDKEQETGVSIILPIVIDKNAWDKIHIEAFKNRKYLYLPDYEKESIKNLSSKLERAIFDWMVTYMKAPPSVPNRLNGPNINATLTHGHLNSIRKFTGSSTAPQKNLMLTFGDEKEPDEKNKMNFGRPCMVLKLANSGSDIEIEEVNIIFGKSTNGVGFLSDADSLSLNSLEFEHKEAMNRFLLRCNHVKEITIDAEIIFEQIINRGIEGIEVIDILGGTYAVSKDEIQTANAYFKKYFKIDGLSTLFKTS